ALVQAHRRLAARLVAQRDVESAGENQEKLIGLGVHVPDVLAAGVRDPDVVVVDPGDDARVVDISERGECGCQVNGAQVHASYSRAAHARYLSWCCGQGWPGGTPSGVR